MLGRFISSSDSRSWPPESDDCSWVDMTWSLNVLLEDFVIQWWNEEKGDWKVHWLKCSFAGNNMQGGLGLLWTHYILHISSSSHFTFHSSLYSWCWPPKQIFHPLEKPTLPWFEKNFSEVEIQKRAAVHMDRCQWNIQWCFFRCRRWSFERRFAP